MVKAHPLRSVARTVLCALIGLSLLAAAGCPYAAQDPLNAILADLVMGHPGFSPFTIRVINETGREAELDLEINGVPALAPMICGATSLRCDTFLNELPRQVSLLELRLYDDTGIQVGGQDFTGLDGYTFNWPIDFHNRSTLLISLTPLGTEVQIIY